MTYTCSNVKGQSSTHSVFQARNPVLGMCDSSPFVEPVPTVPVLRTKNSVGNSSARGVPQVFDGEYAMEQRQCFEHPCILLWCGLTLSCWNMVACLSTSRTGTRWVLNIPIAWNGYSSTVPNSLYWCSWKCWTFMAIGRLSKRILIITPHCLLKLNAKARVLQGVPVKCNDA